MVEKLSAIDADLAASAEAFRAKGFEVQIVNGELRMNLKSKENPVDLSCSQNGKRMAQLLGPNGLPLK